MSGTAKGWASLLIASLVAGGTAAVFVARAVAAAEIRPLEERATKHIAEDDAFANEVRRWRKEDREDRKLDSAKLDALCRATPQARCPLGQ